MAEKKNGDILYADDFNGKQDRITKDTELSIKKLSVAQTINVQLLKLGGDNGHSIYSTDCLTISSTTGDALLRGLKTPIQSNDAANKKYVDDNSGAGKKFGSSEIFNDYENNKTYLYKGVKVANVTSTTNSSTFTLESVAGLAVGRTFNIAYIMTTDINSGYFLYPTQLTIASIDTTNKTITTTTKYSGPGISDCRLYVVNSPATYTIPLYETYSHAEGYYNIAGAPFSHAEGWNTKALGKASHAEGSSTTTSGMYSHAEGNGTTASGQYSHAEGNNTTADSICSHAEGSNTIANAICSHAQNFSTKAGYESQTTMGKYNNNKSDTLLEVGNGTSDTKRSNAFEVYKDGHAEVQTQGTTDNSVVIKSEFDKKQDKFATVFKSSDNAAKLSLNKSRVSIAANDDQRGIVFDSNYISIGGGGRDFPNTGLLVEPSYVCLIKPTFVEGVGLTDAPASLLGVATPLSAADTTLGITADDLPYQAANKKYVDDKIAELTAKIEALSK